MNDGEQDKPARTNENRGEDEEPAFRVEDKRHWARSSAHDASAEGGDVDDDTEPPPLPTRVEEYRQRAEGAEMKLRDYVAAFKESQAEQEQFRERMTRDIDRRVELKFGGLVVELLEALDDLDLALAHSRSVPEADPLTQGVALARTRFIAALERQGVAAMDVDGLEFDPNIAEAVRVDPVADREMGGRITETLRLGYRLGERVLRPARVAVGRHDA